MNSEQETARETLTENVAIAGRYGRSNITMFNCGSFVFRRLGKLAGKNESSPVNYLSFAGKLRSLIAKPDKTPRDLFMIAGLVCLTACVVVFVVGPVTSAIIYLAGKGIARG